LNSDNSFFKEKELGFVDLSSTNSNENSSFVKDKLNCQDKYMSDQDKKLLDDNSFPQITDIQTYIEETETRILEAFNKGSRLYPILDFISLKIKYLNARNCYNLFLIINIRAGFEVLIASIYLVAYSRKRKMKSVSIR
jgi:hypothetical protein